MPQFKYKSSGDVVIYDASSVTKTYTTEDGWISLQLSNDGNTTIVLTVNEMNISILAGEILDENFVTFDEVTVTITTTGSYRLFLRS
jgi:hypothetical protein